MRHDVIIRMEGRAEALALTEVWCDVFDDAGTLTGRTQLYPGLQESDGLALARAASLVIHSLSGEAF